MQHHFHFDLILNIYSLREATKVLMGIYELSKDTFFFSFIYWRCGYEFFFCHENFAALLRHSCWHHQVKKTWVGQWTLFLHIPFETCSQKGHESCSHYFSTLVCTITNKSKFDHIISSGRQNVPVHFDDLHYYYLQDKTKIKGEDKLTFNFD